TLFVLENYPMAESSLNGGSSFKITDLRVTDVSNYPLVLVAVPGARLSLKALFDRQRLAPATARRLLEQFAAVLTAFAGAPGVPLALVAAMTAAEQHQVVVEWNDTAREHPDESTVHGLFEEQARRRPAAVALESGGERLTYEGLERRANRLARHLRRFDVGPDVVVGMAVERSIDMVVALLAILKAGGAYLPLDTALPEQRLDLLLKESRAALVLVRGGSLLAPGTHGMRVIDLDTCREEFEAEAELPSAVPVTPENLAYVIYTSGSTGQPKGVMVHHRGVVNYLRWAVDAYDVAAGEGAPVHSALGFDLTVTSLFAPLLAGKSVELLPQEGGLE